MLALFALLALFSASLSEGSQDVLSPEPAPVDFGLTKQAPSVLEAHHDLHAQFLQLDTSRDGTLSSEERKLLDPRDQRMLQVFDVDEDNELSRREFMMAPFFLTFLEESSDVYDEYAAFREGSTSSCPPHIRPFLKHRLEQHLTGARTAQDVQDQQDRQMRASLKGQRTSTLADTPTPGPLGDDIMRFQQVRKKVDDDPMLTGEPNEAMLEAEAKSQLQTQSKTGTKFLGAVLGGVMGALTKTPDKPKSTRPKSNWGIPSFFDERCVMCQWLMQRMQTNVYSRLVDDPNMIAAPGGDVMVGGGLADSFGNANPVDQAQVVEQAMQRPGGKGVLRIIGQDTLEDFCAPRFIPEIFSQYCKPFRKKLDKLVACLSFGFTAGASCAETSLCSLISYAGKETSVHMPQMSKVFNGARGKECGFMGGQHGNPMSPLKKILCHAKNAIMA